jgi:hypothetical protein
MSLVWTAWRRTDGHPSVHRKCCPCYERRLVRDKEQHCPSHLVRLTDAAQWVRLCKPRPCFLRCFAEPTCPLLDPTFGHRRADHARADGVDVHVVSSTFQS